jgi:hypothetical protein
VGVTYRGQDGGRRLQGMQEGGRRRCRRRSQARRCQRGGRRRGVNATGTEVAGAAELDGGSLHPSNREVLPIAGHRSGYHGRSI